jgi:hypothetical protein
MVRCVGGDVSRGEWKSEVHPGEISEKKETKQKRIDG